MGPLPHIKQSSSTLAAPVHGAEAKRTRLSLDLDPTAKAQLEQVQRRTRSGSMTDVIRRAVTLFDLVTEHSDQGGP